MELASVEGLVLTGGCALNVKASTPRTRARTHHARTHAHRGTFQTNEQVRMALGASRRIYVPAAPNDAGLAVGGAWLVSPPRLEASTYGRWMS